MIRIYISILVLVLSLDLPAQARVNTAVSNSKGGHSTPIASTESKKDKDKPVAKTEAPRAATTKLAAQPADRHPLVTNEIRHGIIAPVPVQVQAPAPKVASIASRARHEVAAAARKTVETTKAVVSNVEKMAEEGSAAIGSRLARVTAYWSSEGDYYTERGIASTGVHLHDGHCAVDPNIIPYGSTVHIEGVGTFLAVDTGSAVIDRTAARESGHTAQERAALVIDLYFESRVDGENFAANGPKFAAITWRTPSSSAANEAQEARAAFAENTESKIHERSL